MISVDRGYLKELLNAREDHISFTKGFIDGFSLANIFHGDPRQAYSLDYPYVSPQVNLCSLQAGTLSI